MPRKSSKNRSEIVIEEEERSPRLPVGDPDDFGPPRDPLEEREDMDIESVISELGSGARVKIARINPDTGSAAHVGEMKAEDFSLDALADVYGGGSYFLRLYRGKEQVGSRVRQDIDPNIPSKNPRGPKSSQQQSGGGNDLMLQMMAESARQSQQMATMMTGVMTAMMSGMANLMQAKNDQESPLEMATKLVELTRTPPREPRPMSELLETVEAIDRLRGGGAEGDGTMAVVKQAIETVGKIAEKTPQRTPATAPARYPVTSPIATPMVTADGSSGGTTTVDPLTLRPWQREIWPHLSTLRMMAGTIEAGTVADIIEQKLSPEGLADLVSDMTAGMPDGMVVTEDTFLSFARGAAERMGIDAQHVPWLSKVAAEVLVIVNDDGGEGGEEKES